ncbi:MAG TPA: signal peptidase I [Candidatus Limnocylindrales bacterium]|nr:signal peptidase I [Candidatus Limnocylindrales bacterium]
MADASSTSGLPANPTPAQGRPTSLGCLIELVETVVLTLLIFVGVQTFVAQPYQVEQESMEETVLPGEYILVDKLTPRFEAYHRGDIVVFHPPSTFSTGPDRDKPFIKRIIGLPGDRIDIRRDGHVAINGTEYDEPYVFEGQRTTARPGTSTWAVPDGEYFVMGDHRQESTDSRDFGPIAAGQIIGRAWLRYWPLDRVGLLPHADLQPTTR